MGRNARLNREPKIIACALFVLGIRMSLKNRLTCPSCHSDRWTLLELLDKNRIVDLFQRKLKMDVERLVKEDISLYCCAQCDLRFFDPPCSGDQEFYAELQTYDWYYLTDKYEFGFAAKHVKAGMNLLEIGSGEGAFALKIPSATYTGLEFSDTAIAAAKSRNVNLLRESIEEHVKNNAGRYDVICTFQVLEHVTDIASFLVSVCECLAVGGLLIVSVPSEDSFMGAEINPPLNIPPHHVSRWTDRALTNLAATYSLQLVEIHHEPLADMHMDSFTAALVHNGLIRFFKSRAHVLEPIALSALFRLVAKPFRHIVQNGLKSIAARPPGHSVCAVYQKTH